MGREEEEEGGRGGWARRVKKSSLSHGRAVTSASWIRASHWHCELHHSQNTLSMRIRSHPVFGIRWQERSTPLTASTLSGMPSLYIQTVCMKSLYIHIFHRSRWKVAGKYILKVQLNIWVYNKKQKHKNTCMYCERRGDFSVLRRFGRLPWWSSDRWTLGRRGRFIVTSPTTARRPSPACPRGRWPKWTTSSATLITRTSNRPRRERWVFLCFVFLENTFTLLFIWRFLSFICLVGNI